MYHSSWILTGLLWAIPTIAIVLIASALGIFRHSSFWVLLLFFLLCSCACIAFAFFFAATFNDAHLGALIGFFIFFLSSVRWQSLLFFIAVLFENFLLEAESTKKHHPNCIPIVNAQVPGFALIQRGNLALTMAVSIFLPPVAFNLGCNILVSAENAVYYSGNETFGVGVTFDTWNAYVCCENHPLSSVLTKLRAVIKVFAWYSLTDEQRNKLWNYIRGASGNHHS